MIIQIIFYIAFNVIGVVLGSFFTLAIYRIPLKQDILYTRSYCPKCNHKLKTIDLIPILSYIFLKGKCRYCHKKISPRYIIIEFFSGLFYLLFVVSLKINVFNINIENVTELLYGTLIISSFFILGGIAKEAKKITKGTIIFGLIVKIIYIIYLYILNINIYRYIIYLIIIAILLIIEKLIKAKKRKNIIYMMIMALFSIVVTNELVFIASAIFTILVLIVSYIIKKQNKKMSWMFYFCFSNIIFLIIYNFVKNFILIV